MGPNISHPVRTALLLSLLFLLITTSPVFAQKGLFEEVEVIDFKPPFAELDISYYGTEMTITINDKTNFKGQKNKKIDPKEIEEGTLINKLTYELVGEKYIALTIETDISADGSIRISGLFEGFRNGKAIIDGYPVSLLPGVNLKGSGKKDKCECKGLLVPNFKSPMVSPGRFFVAVQGKLDDQGVVNASNVELCRNNFGQPERDLLDAVNSSLTNETKPLTNIPTEIASINMKLYNGEVKVGQYSYKLADDIKLQGYINQVGYKLLPKRAKKAQLDQGTVYYRFYVIDDPVPNAFAFPNGMIFIHTGLLDIIENEAQLAAVLGHEIAHVTHEHGRERYETTGLLKNVKGIFEGLMDKSLKKKISNLAPELSDDLAASVMDLTKAITPATISNIVKPQTTMESQADRVGLFYAYQAGYDIREAARFWGKMQELTQEQSFQSKITSDLMNALNSPRLSYSDDNIITKLGAAGSDVLAKQILDTIYTSHPKAKKRARAINKLVSTVYAETMWDKMKVKGEKYVEMVTK